VVEGIIRPRLNEIFDVIGSEIQKSGFAGMTPSGIVICGGGALTVGAVDTCKKNLALPARTGEPTKISGLIDDVLSPAFAASVGLILQADKEISSPRFNLPRMGKILPKIPFKGGLGKVVELVKSFLP